jgi:hypothetical protein
MSFPLTQRAMTDCTALQVPPSQVWPEVDRPERSAGTNPSRRGIDTAGDRFLPGSRAFWCQESIRYVPRSVKEEGHAEKLMLEPP